MLNSAVSGPRETSRELMTSVIFVKQSRAKRATETATNFVRASAGHKKIHVLTTACEAIGFGIPATATY